MEKIHYIYEFYDRMYSGLADYKGKLVHFDFKAFINASYPSTYLFEVMPATKDFLHREISGEKYLITCCEQSYPSILELSQYSYEREKRELADIKLEHPHIVDELWLNAEAQFQNYLFREAYLAENFGNVVVKRAVVYFNRQLNNQLPYENCFIDWLD